MQPTNLDQFYKSQGQALPSVSNRVATAAKAGIQNYTGTADQNNQLLSYLQTPAPQTGATNIQTPASPVQVPTPTNTPVPDINAATTTAPVQQYADTTNYDKSVADYQNLVNQEAQRAPDQLAAEQAAGVNEATATVNDLSSQLTSLNNESAAQKIALQNQPILGSIVAGQQDAVDRSRAVKALTISSALSAAQGKLGLAQAQADKAIAAKYGPIEAKLKYQQDFINLNYQNLSREDKKKADAFQVELDKYKVDVAKQKSDTEDIQALMLEVAKNGGDATLIDKISSAKSVNEAYKIATPYIGKLDRQSVALDNAYKQSQISKNQADARAAVGQLPASAQTKVQSIASQFDGEQAVKNYQTIVEQIDAVTNAGDTPTDDIQRIYAFAKVMDPTSAVKEGEYKSIEDYSQALMTRQGIKLDRVFNNNGFLTEDARTKIMTTLNNRLSSSQKAYDNIYNSYGSRINKVTGSNDGTEYITDYSAAFKATPAQEEQKSEQKIKTYIQNNPTKKQEILKNSEILKQTLGREPTSSEYLQAFSI